MPSLIPWAGEKGKGKGKKDMKISLPLGEGTSPITLKRKRHQGSQWNHLLFRERKLVCVPEAGEDFQPGSLFPYF